MSIVTDSLPASRTDSNDNVSTTTADFETLVVLEFAPGVPDVLKDWILQEIQHRGDGGAMEITVLQTVRNIVHLGMPTEKLLLAAELMRMKKMYCKHKPHCNPDEMYKDKNSEEIKYRPSDDIPREFNIADLHNFKSSGDLTQFLTRAEKQLIVLHELESIRVLDTDKVPKDDKLRPILNLNQGETLIPRCQRDGIIVNCFPLHNNLKIDELASKWYKSFAWFQPLDDIKSYFGVKIAMYFAFLEYYTMFLIPPAVLGLFGLPIFGVTFLDHFVPIFCVFNLVWVAIFLETWKKQSASLTCRWGTIRTEAFEEPHRSYYGALGVNPITGNMEVQYPKYKRRLKFFLGTVPFVTVSMYIAYRVMLFYFWMEDLVDVVRNDETMKKKLVVFKYMPTVVYVLVVMVLNAVYRNLAIRLNIWENHRLQSSYDNHLIVKLLLFNFANCFMSLFYVAFYLQDLELLRYYLGTLLIVQQVVQQFQEAGLPYIIQRIKTVKQRKEFDEAGLQETREAVFNRCRSQAEFESTKDEYSGTLDDYLEMFIQFGYVFLFSAVFPSAAFWALLNNITEIRTDAFKLCRTYKRPFAQSASSIGIWATAFKTMSVIAIITNCSLVALSPSVQPYTAEYGPATTIFIFVIIEHIILLIRLTISFVIPNEPKSVSIALAKVEFELKEEWKKQREKEAKKHLKGLPSTTLESTTKSVKFGKAE